MARTAWKLEDTVLAETYFLPVNPHTDDAGMALSKVSTYQVVAATYQDSSLNDRIGTLIQLAPDEQVKFGYTGNVYNKAELEAWEYWASKPYPIEMTDDLGRTFLVYLESFQPSRVRSRQYPWKHSYKLTGWVFAEIV